MMPVQFSYFCESVFFSLASVFSLTGSSTHLWKHSARDKIRTLVFVMPLDNAVMQATPIRVRTGNFSTFK